MNKVAAAATVRGQSDFINKNKREQFMNKYEQVKYTTVPLREGPPSSSFWLWFECETAREEYHTAV